ncbi:MAG: helix-turn-helix domain-containing protein [Planctomycetia bacterium]
MRSVAHSVSMTVTGRHSVRWICRGRERAWIEHPGTVHFRPCDGLWQDFLIHAVESGDVTAFFMPSSHLDEIARSEAIDGGVEWGRALLPNDAILQRSMLTLSACRTSLGEEGGRADEAARRLVLRLVEIACGKKPEWHDDASVFDRNDLARLIDYVDAHLRGAPSLNDMALRVGLSPSHFAKKFRQSTGLSLHRFINRRRILRSLDMLKRPSQSLAGVSLDLGFSSQSHFTRLFSGLTGITPAKYRKQYTRAIGSMPL